VKQTATTGSEGPAANAAGRVGAAARRWGIGLGPEDANGLAALVERVEAGLDGIDGPRGAPPDGTVPVDTAPGPAPDRAAGSAWVWKASADERAGRAASGPLAGWRIGVKDLVAVAGHPVRCGSAATWDAPAEAADAPIVASLRDAGGVVVGATKLHEFAFGTTGVNAPFGTPDNPVAPGRVPGGSSSGSGAAVASAEADLAVGTDTGGSVRIPAALCGVVGLKPSSGALPTDGVVALSPTLDHVGFLVGDVEHLVTASAALGLLGPGGAREVTESGSLRLGVARGVTDLCDGEVVDGWLAALERLAGAFDLVEVDWPGGEAVFAATTAIMFAEAAHGHAARLARRGHLYGVDVRNRLLQGAALDARTYLRARDVRRELGGRCVTLLADGDGAGRLDAVLTPTVPIVAPRLADAVDPAVGGRLVTFTRLADLVGLPALSIPVPGVPLPVGLQLEAAGDADVVRAGWAVARRLRG
jgi:amidase